MVEGIELRIEDAIDLIDEILDDCIIVDAKTDSPHPELKDKTEFAEYIVGKFLFKDKIARDCAYWKEGKGCVVHHPHQKPLKNPDCIESGCTYYDKRVEDDEKV